MRRTKIKSARDVVNKINTWIKAVSEERIEIQPFSKYITEGRPAIADPDARRPGDKEKQLRVAAQQKKYKPEEVANIARKHKVRMDGEPIPGNGDWLIAVRGGVTLDYDYRNNETYIKGWKVDRKKIRAHINKYEQGGSTYEDLLGRGGHLNVRGFESAFELIGEQFELDEASRTNTKMSGKLVAKRMKTIKSMKPYASKVEKMKTVSVIDLERMLPGDKVRMADIDNVMQDWGWPKEFTEEAPANKTGVNVVGTGDDPTVWVKKKKRINAKVKYEDFGGTRVFVVPNERWHASRLGKNRYARYEKYIGNDKLGETIRLYGRENPKSPIILKNEENGAMLYLKYGGSKRTW